MTERLQYTCKRIDWEELSLNIDGESLNHLRFADAIVMVTDSIDQASVMLERLYTPSGKIKIYFTKTQLMTNFVPSDNISVAGKPVEQATLYKYFGHEIRIGRDNQTCELLRV